MLVDLQLLDVDPSDDVRGRCRNDHHADDRPGRHITTKGMRRHDDRSSAGNCRQQNDQISIDAVQNHGLVPNDRDELQHDQDAGREDAEEVDHHADFVGVLEVEVAFPRRCGVAGRATAEDVVVAEVLKAGGAETQDVAKSEESCKVISEAEETVPGRY